MDRPPIYMGGRKNTTREGPAGRRRFMIKRLVKRIAETSYVRCAMTEQADLSAFREKPTPRMVAGITAMALSYIIGWPAVSGLGILSIYLHEPMILVIGGPVTYGLSHLVFILGMYLAGVAYVRVFFRWLTRIGVEKLLAWFPAAVPETDPSCPPEQPKATR